ncbi:MAG: dienelactone hydrolase family protein [Gammaproteobacteria bacterium]|nr:dienelactone hydrolase family protein [Pseudomonadales bacterium]MCP5345718.1 dienelactone hydrolase family protein [Pseudomonadales bacterium]
MNKNLLIAVLAGMLATQAGAAENESLQGLVTEFWNARSDEERGEVGQRLLASQVGTDALYRQFRSGPRYSDGVAVGYQDLVREAPDGTRFPYVLLVPESYDPTVSYPVEFMLHGGVSRPYPTEPGSWWRRGYDSLRSEEKIVVVPAAWDEAFWWFANQAENVSEILHEVKRQYNVADNQVTLTGVSDGGTGAYFFAFKQNTEWAAFMPYIGHPGVLRNPAGKVSYQLYFENLMGKPLYMVNGENDPLYPASSLEPFVNVLRQANITHVFRVIPGGGHNTDWLPEESPAIEQFKLEHPRDPIPDSIRWVADSEELYNRSHWVIIDDLANDDESGMVRASRDGNTISVATVNVDGFTLLLSPDEIDFSRPVAIYINDSLRRSERLQQDSRTLLKWAARDLDKSMLFTAELNLRVGE